MTEFITKVRSYGWWCYRCECHKSVTEIRLARATNYIGVVCKSCNTELLDCFLIAALKNCDSCLDRFQCLTRADVTVKMSMETARTEEIRIPPRKLIDAMEKEVTGIRAYTGVYNDKLESDDTCHRVDREDCNNSTMRHNYNGQPYRRCAYMKYDREKEEWYCWYGREKRGQN